MNLNTIRSIPLSLYVDKYRYVASPIFYSSYPLQFTNRPNLRKSFHNKKAAANLTNSVELYRSYCTMKFDYPAVRRDETVKDVYHGLEVADPYRWLEDPDCEETKQFVEAQNNITVPYIHSCQYRDKVNAKLTQMWDYPKYSCPYRHGDKYFHYMNTGLQNQSVLHVQDALEGSPRVFLDPNTLSTDGTVALSGTSFSEDESIMAYTLSRSGSDWVTIYFKDVQTGEAYPDKLERVKFTSMAWMHDNKGIFYGQYPKVEGKADGSETDKNENYKLYYHRVGTPQSEDVMVVEFPEEPGYICDAEVSDCGRWLLVFPRKLCKDNLVYFSDLSALSSNGIEGKLKLTQVVHKLEADYDYVTNNGSEFIFRTNKDAPNYRLVKIDFEMEDEPMWETLIAEHPSDVLDWASAVAGNKLVLCYIHDVKSVLQVHDMETGNLIKELPLPMGNITGYSGKRKYPDIFYQYTSFLSPGIIYKCDLSQEQFQPQIFREIKLPGFDPTLFEQAQVFYPSKDGTRIPMFIIYKKGLKLDGSNGCLLYGYGGFNVSLQPVFSVTRLVFIKHLDGVMAIPNLRGGGEYGEKWHDGGRLLNKQNVFDDFIAAGEYLIENRYTSSSKLAIQGGSNGGLLVAACLNQRPDLFAAGICQVGVLDMLRYHKFTIGAMWVSDFGNPDEEKHFHNLIKYSPLHNIKVPQEQYPATFLTTADHDDRVVPLHSLKFIATLQHTMRNNPKQKNPLVIRIDTKAGHGGGKPTTKVIEEYTDVLCFLINSMGLKFED